VKKNTADINNYKGEDKNPEGSLTAAALQFKLLGALSAELILMMMRQQMERAVKGMTASYCIKI